MSVFNYEELKKKLNTVKLPDNREWGTLIVKKFSYIAFMDMENGSNNRKIIIRKNLHVDVYLKQKPCPWIKFQNPANINEVNQILYIVNKIKV